jgi:FkbM family methyltransferase
VAILGHDLEIKTTYASMLPRLFFDVGANYRLHALLFLVHCAPTVSFEPNTASHKYLRRACELNHLVCDIQALSDAEGSIELCSLTA